MIYILIFGRKKERKNEKLSRKIEELRREEGKFLVSGY